MNPPHPKRRGNGLGRTLRLQEGTPAVHCVLFPFQMQVTMPGPSSWCSVEHWNVTTVPTSVPLPWRTWSEPSWGGRRRLHCPAEQAHSHTMQRHSQEWRATEVLLTPDCKSVPVNGQNKYQTSGWPMLAALPSSSPRPASLHQCRTPPAQSNSCCDAICSDWYMLNTETLQTLSFLSGMVPYRPLSCWILFNLVLRLASFTLGVFIMHLPPCKFPSSSGLIMQFSLLGSILAWSNQNFLSLQALHLCLAWLKGAKGIKTTGRGIERHTHTTYLPFQVTNSALQ